MTEDAGQTMEINVGIKSYALPGTVNFYEKNAVVPPPAVTVIMMYVTVTHFIDIKTGE